MKQTFPMSGADILTLAPSWGPAPRLTSRIPFGYALDPEDDKILLPVTFELESLETAKSYLKEGHSLRSVASWLQETTKRKITHEGLRQRVESDKRNGHRTPTLRRLTESLAVSAREIRDYDIKHGNGTEWYDNLLRYLQEKAERKTSEEGEG